MDKAYDSFRYADRLKSNLLLVIDAVDELSKLRGIEQEGGRKLTKRLLERLRNELNIASNYLPVRESSLIRNKLMEAEGNAMLCNYSKASQNLAEAMVQITTLANRFMNTLKNDKNGKTYNLRKTIL